MSVWLLFVFNQGFLEESHIFGTQKLAESYKDWHSNKTKLGLSEYTEYEIVKKQVARFPFWEPAVPRSVQMENHVFLTNNNKRK